jgi:hypothetical protein
VAGLWAGCSGLCAGMAVAGVGAAVP